MGKKECVCSKGELTEEECRRRLQNVIEEIWEKEELLRLGPSTMESYIQSIMYHVQSEKAHAEMDHHEEYWAKFRTKGIKHNLNNTKE